MRRLDWGGSRGWTRRKELWGGLRWSLLFGNDNGFAFYGCCCWRVTAGLVLLLCFDLRGWSKDCWKGKGVIELF